MPDRALRRLLIALLAVTLPALLWNTFGMNSTLAIDARSQFVANAIDERQQASSESAAVVTRVGDAIGLECRVAAVTPQTSCELRLEFGKEGGVDLSRYDGVRLWLSATGPEAKQRVRVYVRNFDPAYSKPGVVDSEKIDQLVYEPAAYPPGYRIPMNRFMVSDKWLDDHPTTLDLAGTDFRHVTMLAFATGPRALPGLHRIRVDRIEFDGKTIPTAAFRLGVIGVWMVCVLGWLVADRVTTRKQLRLSAASESSLQRLNESLRIETRSLAEIARTDALSGALNRKGLADELMRTVRMGGDAIFPLTLVFIDIDHFKRINDTHGHDVGDQVIRGLADLVRSAVQRDDLFARWGGEEFLLVFRNMPGLEGQRIAERLRERIASAQWPGGQRITSSFGVAEWRQGEELHEGIKRADEAMYRAKQNGRDRVEIELGLESSESVA